MGWYDDTIVASGRAGIIWMLVAFAVTFLITRGITRKIRRERVDAAALAAEAAARGEAPGEAKGGIVGDVNIGGVHIHHQVWGLLLMLVAGMLEFAFEFSSPWLEVLGILFGAGAALVLDEFALFLHLDDVYWSAAGQKSIDAVVATMCVMAALILGSGPMGITADNVENAPIGIPVAIAVNLTLVVLCLMKGKIVTAAVGFFVPFVALIGAIRLAQVTSWWARRRYAGAPRKRQRAEQREMALRRRRERIRVTLGGAPDADL